jgi:pyochelin biosynthesis protein PchG
MTGASARRPDDGAWRPGDGAWRPKVVVCGTGFGRVYLSALRRPQMPFELVGILARGSRRSRDCAEHYGVPLYADVDDVPAVDIACVVVGGALNGGSGAQLAQRLMARGVHVLQEHPLHQSELAACLRAARRHGVVYHLNAHYVHVDAVRRFLHAADRLRRDQAPLFVDALSSIQVLYPLFDILTRAIGAVRPCTLSTVDDGDGRVLRTLYGSLGGVPLTLRVQNELDPVERDNGAHVTHRVTLATEGGNLLLANTHGPVLWSPRLYMPPDYHDVITVAQSAAAHLDLPATSVVGPARVPSYREIVGEEWPRATARALHELRRAILAAEDPLPGGQHHLALCEITARATAQLGVPALRAATASRPAIEEAARLVLAGVAEHDG